MQGAKFSYQSPATSHSQSLPTIFDVLIIKCEKPFVNSLYLSVDKRLTIEMTPMDFLATPIFLSMSVQDEALCEIIPNHHDRRSHDLRKHIPYPKKVDAAPHDKLIQPQPHERRHNKEHHLFRTLILCMKDHIDAENVIHKEGNRKSNRCRDQRRKTAILRQCEQQDLL